MMKILDWKEYNGRSSYDHDYELRILDENGSERFILLDRYNYFLNPYQDGDKIDEDEIFENFIILENSILDRGKNMRYDEFQELIMENEIPIEEFEEKIFNINILNGYINLINDFLLEIDILKSENDDYSRIYKINLKKRIILFDDHSNRIEYDSESGEYLERGYFILNSGEYWIKKYDYEKLKKLGYKFSLSDMIYSKDHGWIEFIFDSEEEEKEYMEMIK